MTKPTINMLSNHWVICIVLALCSFFSNVFISVDMFGDISLHAGSFFVVLSIFTLPLKLALLVLISSLIPFTFFSISLMHFVIYTLEFMVIVGLLKLKMGTLSSTSITWVLVIFPALCFFIYWSVSFHLLTATFIALVISLNGYFFANTALLCYSHLPFKSKWRKYKPAPPKFSDVVFEINLISVMLPIIFVTLLFTWRSIGQNEKALTNELVYANAQISFSVNNMLKEKQSMLIEAADMLSQTRYEGHENIILNSVANSNDGVESMIVADTIGQVLLAAPERYAQIINKSTKLSIASRSYFQLTKETNSPVVSEALQGRGLGDLKIVAITAPILRSIGFDGIVQAAVTLENFVDLSVVNTIELNEIMVVITDSADAIIYSSPGLNFDEKDLFSYAGSSHPIVRNTETLLIDKQQYIHLKETNKEGWHIYTLTPVNKVFMSIEGYIIFLASSILGSIVLITLMANRLAFKITRPLVNLEKFIANEKPKEEVIDEAQISKEMLAVTSRFIETHLISQSFQQRLGKEVEQKTRELKLLNKKLFKLSQTDKLSGLYNRGAFDSLAEEAYRYCVTERESFSVFMLDIDNFKVINDNYGHQTGDECIQGIAATLDKAFRRQGDIVARYGGEEFIIFMSLDDCISHQAYISKVHKAISESVVYVENQGLSITLSVGGCCVKEDFSHSLSHIIKLADQALYKSKQAGRNCINTYIV